MADMLFSDILKVLLEGNLSGKSYISGEEITKQDANVYALLSGKPSSESYPNASKWYDAVSKKLVSSYSEKAGWVSKEASADDANKESTAKGDDVVVVEEAEEEKKVAQKRKREDEEEKESSTKRKESEKTWTLRCTYFCSMDDESAEIVPKRMPNVTSYFSCGVVTSAEAVVLKTTADGRREILMTFNIRSDIVSEDDDDKSFFYVLDEVIDEYVLKGCI